MELDRRQLYLGMSSSRKTRRYSKPLWSSKKSKKADRSSFLPPQVCSMRRIWAPTSSRNQERQWSQESLHPRHISIMGGKSKTNTVTLAGLTQAMVRKRGEVAIDLEQPAAQSTTVASSFNQLKTSHKRERDRPPTILISTTNSK